MSFFSDQVLSKRGPLGKVWLASHLERKLSKSALLQTNIPNSVTAILGSGDEVVPVMALRLSGQLLLGVARIYSRKAKYLQDDCSEALVKIKLAFRTVPNANGLAGGNGTRARGARGDVDMVEDEAGRANINLNIGGDGRGVNDFDVLYNAEFGGFGIWDDFNMTPLAAPQTNRKDKANRNTVANQADITLREDHNLDFDYDRTIDLNFGDEEGIGSQEYRARSAELEGGDAFGDDFELGLDLDLELDLGLMDDDIPPAGADNEEAGEPRQRRDESPAAYAARQRKDKSTGTSRIASIAAQARELSEAPSEALSEVPSVEYGRDAATPMSIRNSDILGKVPEGLDDSVLKGHEEADSFDMDIGGPDFGAAGDGTSFDFGGDNYDTSLPQDGQQTPRGTTPAASVRADDEERQATPNPPAVDEGDETQTQIDMTPHTAARVAEAAAVGSAQRKRKEAAEGAAARPKPAKVRKQIVDSVTELAERGRGLGSQGSQSQGSLGAASLASREERMAQGLLKEPKYLPATTVEMRFQEIYDHPGKFFFAGMTGFAGNGKTPGVQSFYAGPPGMPAELQALFQFRLGEKGQILGAKRAPDVTVEDDDRESEERRKRARSSVAPEVEIGRERQQSLTPGADGVNMFNFGAGGNNFDDFGAGGDPTNDFSLDLGNMSPGLDISNAAAAMEKTPSRLGSARPTSSPDFLDRSLQLDFDGIDRASTSILAVFDDTPASKGKMVSTPAGIGRTSKTGYLSVPGTRQSGISEEQSQLEESVHSASIAASRGKTGGWSRNTVKALKILEHELGPAPSTENEDAEESEPVPKAVSFQALSDKASRKAAASMFFEMLILGTRECIKLKQPEAYGDISVSSKEKLWQVCDGLNKLSVDADEGDETRSALGESRQGTPNVASSDAGETPTRNSQSRPRASTPVVSSSRSRRTAQMSM